MRKDEKSKLKTLKEQRKKTTRLKRLRGKK